MNHPTDHPEHQSQNQNNGQKNEQNNERNSERNNDQHMNGDQIQSNDHADDQTGKQSGDQSGDQRGKSDKRQAVDRKTWIKLIISYGIFFLLAFAFTELAEEVMEESTMALDIAVLKAINDHSTPGLDRMVLLLTDLAGPIFIPIAALLLFAFFIYRKEKYNSIYVLLSLGGTFLVNTALKLYFQRARPDLWTLLVEEESYSFPSGHAMISMAIALTLIVLVYNSRLRISALILGILYVLAIGFSRLYLGVHYPTDIIGGWLASIVWVGLATRIMMRNTAFRQDTLT